MTAPDDRNDSDTTASTTAGPIHVVAVGAVDPDTVRSDALAQVIEHQLRRRLGALRFTIEFRSTTSPTDPRRRTRWQPASSSDWADRATVIVDLGMPDGSVPASGTPAAAVVTLDTTGAAGLFARQVDGAALETRRLMLTHLGISAERPPFALTATDHLALGTSDAAALDVADLDHADLDHADLDHDGVAALHRAFDTAAHAIAGLAGARSPNVEALVAEIERLESSDAAARATRDALDVEIATQLAAQAARISQLEARLEAASLLLDAE